MRRVLALNTMHLPGVRCAHKCSPPKGPWMSQSRVLADQLYSGEGAAADLVRIAAANILLILCAHVVIPLPFTPVPITGQTFGVLLVAVLFGARRNCHTPPRIQVRARWRAAGRCPNLRRSDYFSGRMRLARSRHAFRMA